MSLCGFTGDSEARGAFDRFVEEHRAPDPLLKGEGLREARRELRAELGSGVEISCPIIDLERREVEHKAIIPPETAIRSGHPVDVTRIIALVAHHRGLSIDEILSPSRHRYVVRARKVVVRLGAILGPNLTEIGRGLGISSQAAGKLAESSEPQESCEALELARTIPRF